MRNGFLMRNTTMTDDNVIRESHMGLICGAKESEMVIRDKIHREPA